MVPQVPWVRVQEAAPQTFEGSSPALHGWSADGAPMERIAIDLTDRFPRTRPGNTSIIVVADYFAKWVEAFPVQDQTSKKVAGVLVEQFITRFGTPLDIHTDQGREFQAELFQDVYKLLRVRKTRTTPFLRMHRRRRRSQTDDFAGTKASFHSERAGTPPMTGPILHTSVATKPTPDTQRTSQRSSGNSCSGGVIEKDASPEFLFWLFAYTMLFWQRISLKGWGCTTYNPGTDVHCLFEVKYQSLDRAVYYVWADLPAEGGVSTDLYPGRRPCW